MRTGLLVVLVMLGLAPSAAADTRCESSAWHVEPAPGAPIALRAEERRCEEVVVSREVSVLDPAGRTTVEWHDDERGRGLAVHRPPRVVSWTEDARGCAIEAAVFGATQLPCAAGAPPAPL